MKKLSILVTLAAYSLSYRGAAYSAPKALTVEVSFGSCRFSKPKVLPIDSRSLLCVLGVEGTTKSTCVTLDKSGRAFSRTYSATSVRVIKKSSWGTIYEISDGMTLINLYTKDSTAVMVSDSLFSGVKVRVECMGSYMVVPPNVLEEKLKMAIMPSK